MPWTFRVIYGERPVLKEVEVELDRASYVLAVKQADKEGHRPPRCRTARSEYVKFVPKDEFKPNPEGPGGRTKKKPGEHRVSGDDPRREDDKKPSD